MWRWWCGCFGIEAHVVRTRVGISSEGNSMATYDSLQPIRRPLLGGAQKLCFRVRLNLIRLVFAFLIVSSNFIPPQCMPNPSPAPPRPPEPTRAHRGTLWVSFGPVLACFQKNAYFNSTPIASSRIRVISADPAGTALRSYVAFAVSVLSPLHSLLRHFWGSSMTGLVWLVVSGI